MSENVSQPFVIKEFAASEEADGRLKAANPVRRNLSGAQGPRAFRPSLICPNSEGGKLVFMQNLMGSELEGRRSASMEAHVVCSKSHYLRASPPFSWASVD